MRRGVHASLVVLGAAMAVYGAASLTGGWLGTPPWQDPPPEFPAPSSAGDRRSLEEETAAWAEYAATVPAFGRTFGRLNPSAPSERPPPPADAAPLLEGEIRRARPWWHKWTGLALCQLGIVAISVGAWPRRPREAPS